MNISESGLDFIAEREALRLSAYPDPATGGDPWTIGYGRAHGVSEGDTCTEERAREWLREDAGTAERCVNASVKGIITQSQFDALCSFVLNLGCSVLRNSTLLKLLNEADDENAAKEFLKWNHANGRVMAGLTNRREAEMNLFLS